MGTERGVVCRECEAFLHLSKTYFPDEWDETLVQEQFEPEHKQVHIRNMMAFMRRHETHNIALINERSSEWRDALFNYDEFEAAPA